MMATYSFLYIFISPQKYSHLLLFLADNSKNFGLIVCLLWQTEMTVQSRIHSVKWNKNLEKCRHSMCNTILYPTSILVYSVEKKEKLYLVFLVRKRGIADRGSSGVDSMMTCPSGKNRRYLWEQRQHLAVTALQLSIKIQGFKSNNHL